MISLSLTLALFSAPTQDWPQYMGPSGNNKVELSGVDFEWGPAGPEILWKTEVGGGYGGVSVRDGRVFLLDREAGEADIMRVLDLKSGEDIWDQAYEAVGRLSYPGSRSVPTVTEDYVLSMGGHGHVTCFDREARMLKWQRNVADDFGGQIPGFGWSNSPLVIGDMVVISVLAEDVGLVGLDVATGKEIWRTKALGGSSHSSPVLFDLLGEEQIIFLSTHRPPGSGRRGSGMTVNSFAPKTGELNWQQNIKGSRTPIPRPIQVDGERIFISGGYGGGSSMHKLVKGEDGHQLEELFHIKRGSQLHSPILHDEHLYFLANENENHRRNLQKEGGLMCLTLDGEELWRTGDDPFFGRGNWVMGGDYLFIQDGFNGTLTVCKASPEGFEPVAESNIFGKTGRKDHEMWAPMALVDGLLLMRSKEELICVNLRRPAE